MPFSIVQEESHSVYTVSRLTAEIKLLLESSFRFIWVKGEISNFRVPSSGHFYFTLKDEQSQIRAVFFRGQNRYLRFRPEDGMQALCQARVGVYEPRGEYQIIVETMEPQGLGALQAAFEQLKKKLAAEGLFDATRKRPLPLCPLKIAIVTSPTGAAIRDILKVLKRSPYPLDVEIYSVPVQGAEAGGEIAAALTATGALEEDHRPDLVIVGRGGGSIEDLWPFNEEVVARAAASCPIPVISAVGHEIDFTISDLVADLRMPTPTAAAEWVVARLEDVGRELSDFRERLARFSLQRIDTERMRLRHLQQRLPDPRRRIETMRLTLDERAERLQRAVVGALAKFTVRRVHLEEKLRLFHPAKIIEARRDELFRYRQSLIRNSGKTLVEHRLRLQEFASLLHGLSPLAVLARGYSITYRLPGKKLLKSSADVRPGQNVLVRLSQGSIECAVRKTEDEVDTTH